MRITVAKHIVGDNARALGAILNPIYRINGKLYKRVVVADDITYQLDGALLDDIIVQLLKCKAKAIWHVGLRLNFSVDENGDTVASVDGYELLTDNEILMYKRRLKENGEKNNGTISKNVSVLRWFRKCQIP